MPSILIVDDVRTEQEIIKKALQPLGYTVLLADTGAKALEVAAKEKPVLIVLDIIMPEMDGYETCRKLKKNPDTKGIPIILCSTKSEESDRYWGERQGANAYVPKPFDPDELLKTARRLI